MYRMNVNDTWEKYQAVIRSVLNRLGRLRVLEIEYATEQARRLLSGRKKSSAKEAMNLNLIRCLIQECKKIESGHNRYSVHQINEFNAAILSTPDYPKSKELVLKQKAYARVAQANHRAKMKATHTIVKQIETTNVISGSNSSKVLDNYIKHDAEVHSAIQSSQSSISDILKDAPKLEGDNK